jgi:hypothetical protein
MKLKLTILGLTLLIFSSMNIYSRALRHISIKDVKQKHQEKIVEKIQEEVRKKEEKQYIQSVMENKKCDWRKELNEQMTTSDVFFTNLPATGDVDLLSTDVNLNFSGGIPGNPGTPVEGLYLRQSTIGPVDSSTYDTVLVTISAPSSLVSGLVLLTSATTGILVVPSGGTSGTYSATLPYTSKSSSYLLAQVVNNPANPGFNITKVSFQRRTPMNVFVSLDSPEATSFIRTDPMMSKLSPAERKKKLREMLASGDEYVEKMLGANFPGTGAVPPGEYDPFKQAPAGEAGDTPGVDISDQDTQIAQQQRGATGVGIPDTTGTSPGSNPPPQSQMNYPKEWLPKQARQAAMTMVASYEPQGELISEKKLKSPEEVLNKIPGYYDGKPAPLGFPETPPPEMVNGMHPDLVDGKKTADRFNRLDPQSAKAMPFTGNPHIDKKVKAATKKPK